MGLLGAVGSTAGIPSLNSLTQQALSSVQSQLMSPDNPVGKLAGQATQITKTLDNAKDKLSTTVQAIQNAPDTIAQAAATAVGQKLESAGISTIGASGAPESAGEPPSSVDPGSVNTTEQQSGGARYEIVHLTKKIRDPLFVFYSGGKPTYYTRSSKGRVKILRLYSDVRKSRHTKHGKRHSRKR